MEKYLLNYILKWGHPVNEHLFPEIVVMVGIMNKLNVGDIIIVSTNIFSKLREYPVLKIEGNKAITKFRTFNTKIYPDGSIYEYRKHSALIKNGYWIKKN